MLHIISLSILCYQTQQAPYMHFMLITIFASLFSLSIHVYLHPCYEETEDLTVKYTFVDCPIFA